MVEGPNFEREKWTQELALKQREVELREVELSRSHWKNPILLSIVSAAVAGTIGILANFFDSQSKIELEERKSDLTLLTSLIKSDDKNVVRDNLAFLVKAKVIRNKELRSDLEAYLKDTDVAQLPAISANLINRENISKVDVCADLAGPNISVEFEKLTPSDLESVARKFNLEPAVLRAFMQVEMVSGQLSRGHPRILFERHYFSRLTGKKFDESHPDISSVRFGGYKGGYAEYGRLKAAAALDCDAALKSTSWGAGQIMGQNYDKAGFDGVVPFSKAMLTSERASLEALLTFIQSVGLMDELQAKNWAAFTRGYNGPAYRVNKYDKKMQEAYELFSDG